MEKKTQKSYDVQEDVNYGILRIYAEFWKKTRKKIFVDWQNNLLHRKTLGKSYRSYRSVPHELTPQQAQHRVNIFRQLIGNAMDDRFIIIVTCDDKWVYYLNPDASNQ